MNEGYRKRLLSQLKQLVVAIETGDCSADFDDGLLPSEEQEVVRSLCEAIKNRQAATEYDIIKYKLANDALNIALWDVDSPSGDPFDPNNIVRWSQEFRHMLGFSDENDFPNTLYSWSDRIHPEDKEMVFNAILVHLNDYTGKTPFDIEYRIMMKSGEYLYFHAFGTTLRDNAGVPRRVAGAVRNITEKRQTANALQEALTETKKTLEIMASILNKSNAMIYVTDPDTNEILFINDGMKQHYGIKGGIGDICYEVFQVGMNERCSFCPCHQLAKEPNKVIVWEEHSTLTQRFYRNSDQYVDWPGGKKAHIQHSFEITDIKQTQNELEHKQKLLFAVNSAATLLLTSDAKSFGNALWQSMKIITEAIKGDRMYIWKNYTVDGELHCGQIYEYSENVEPQQGKYFTFEVSYSDYVPRWEIELSSGRCINNVVRDMPLKEQELLLPQGIISILVMPVFINDQYWGFVGFDDCRNERIFTKEEETILRSASLLFANAVMRHEMQHKIFEEKEFNQILFESSPVGLEIYNDSYECLNCSDMVLNMLETSEKYYIEHISEFAPEYQPNRQKSSDKVKELIDRALSGETLTSEWEYISTSGESIPCEITLTRTKRDNQYVVLVYTYDLRLYKAIEKEANEANERAKLMLDSNPLICILRDEQNNVIDCNQEALKFFDVSAKKDLRNNYHRFYPEFQPDGSKSIEKVQFLLKNLMENKSIESFEWTFQNIKGEQMPVETKFVLIQWEGVNLILSYSRDLREIKVKERELAEITEREHNERLQREAAQAANDVKSQFLAHMSHEIRTPMNAVLGMSELLLQENLSRRQLRYVGDIKTSAMALLEIINDILDVSKIEAGKFNLVPAHYDFNEMVENLKSIVHFLIKDKNIIFKLDLQENIPTCLYGDDVRLRQVLLNILSNAIKFTEKGYVQLSVSCTDDMLKMTVSDTGMGIPAEKIQTLFDAFEQVDTHKNRNTTGTGLGLTITKSIVEMMDGKITLESVYGQGTSISVEIPKVLGDEALIAHTDTKETVLYAPDAKILVVDDNQINLNVASGLLQLYHISVDRAESGKQAIEMLQRKEYDMVLMDYMMPEMTGTEAVKVIRELGITVPIIALTASAVIGAKEMMLEAGMDDYLAKPIIKLELLQMLKKWLPIDKLLNSPAEAITVNKVLDEKDTEFWNTIAQIEELSLLEGLNRVNGQWDVYEQILRLMVQESSKSIKKLNEFLSANDMNNFCIEVHGLKGALANIGVIDLSTKAFELETASSKQDSDFCRDNLPALLDGIIDLNSKLSEAFSIISQSGDLIEIPPELPLIFQRMKEAFSEIDIVWIDEEVENLDALKLNGTIKNQVEQIKDMVLMMDYDGAIEHMQILLNGN